MKERKYENIGEMMLEECLENGLSVYIFPKAEFEKKFAFFATNYGGMDTRFQVNGTWKDTPMGVAHFLEHKMFDTKEGNALQVLSGNGASPNAFTGSAITGYYFEGSEGFYENLETLLSFVSIPYFTQESVEKEQGIIGQEIRMIEDNPNWQLYMGLLEALYKKHPIRNSVAGSQESIAQITAETLYQCHEAFYHPENMVLCIAGDVEPERVYSIARILPKEVNVTVTRDHGTGEPEEVYKTERVLPMEVSTPLMLLGIKLLPEEDGKKRLRQKLVGELVCESLMGTSSVLYETMYKEGLINHSFFYGYEEDSDCAFLVAGGESGNPEAVRTAILDEVLRIGHEGLDERLFARLKKAAYGNQMRSLNSFENLCIEQARAHFARQDIWIFPEIYATISKEDIETAVREWICKEKMELSVIRPKEAGL